MLTWFEISITSVWGHVVGRNGRHESLLSFALRLSLHTGTYRCFVCHLGLGGLVVKWANGSGVASCAGASLHKDRVGTRALPSFELVKQSRR